MTDDSLEQDWTATRVFCPLPWLHISMNAVRSEYRPCCVSNLGIMTDEKGVLSIVNSTPEEALDAPAMVEIRDRIRRGERVDACSVCYSEEELGVPSMRRISARQHHVNLAEIRLSPFRPIGIRNLELRLGNLCNLKCVMCSAEKSSAFEGVDPVIPGRDAIGNLDRALRSTEVLVFRGGEPLINPSHEDILVRLIESGRCADIGLVYSTNGTRLPARLRELWREFKSVAAWVSIDGTAEVNEFIRYPSRWASVAANLRRLDEWAGDIVALSWGITMTVQAYNVLEITRLANFMADYSFAVRFPFLNLLHDPLPLRVDALPFHVRSRAALQLRDWLRNHSDGLMEYETPLKRKLNALKGTATRTRENLVRAETLIPYLLSDGAGGDSLPALRLWTENLLSTRQCGAPSFLSDLDL